MSQRILVTGGGGFMGRHALPHLLNTGYEVHVAALEPFPNIADVVWHSANLLDFHVIDYIIAEVKPKICLHLAWDVCDGYWTSPANLGWTVASLSLLQSFTEHGGKRFVGVGSCAEYDWSHAENPLREDAPRHPTLPYGVAKDSLRRMVESYCQQNNVSHAWATLFFAYGSHERANRLVPSIIRNLYHNEPVAMTRGLQRRDFMDSRDIGHALATLTMSEVNGAVNVASGKAPSILEIAQILERHMGCQDLLRPGLLPDREGDPALLQADITRLQDEVGFTPSYSLEQGLSDTVNWWRNQLSMEQK